MDITLNLTERPISYDSDPEGFKNYVLILIEEVVRNFLNLRKLYFGDSKVFDFKSLVGITQKDLIAVKSDLVIFLNQNLTDTFKNLKLKFVGYDFVDDIEKNALYLSITLSCDLLGMPKSLNYRLKL